MHDEDDDVDGDGDEEEDAVETGSLLDTSTSTPSAARSLFMGARDCLLFDFRFEFVSSQFSLVSLGDTVTDVDATETAVGA